MSVLDQFQNSASLNHIDGKPQPNVSIDGALGKSFYAVAASDTVDLPQGSTVGLYVGVTGDVAIISDGGTPITLTALSGGIIHPISAKRVKATGTTATGIVAVY